MVKWVFHVVFRVDQRVNRRLRQSLVVTLASCPRLVSKKHSRKGEASLIEGVQEKLAGRARKLFARHRKIVFQVARWRVVRCGSCIGSAW